MIGFAALGKGLLDLRRDMDCQGYPPVDHAVPALRALLAEAEGRVKPERATAGSSKARTG